jgi:hypothetical protein
MIGRDIVKITDKYRESFPVLAFTGARQQKWEEMTGGKTSIVAESKGETSNA